MKYLVIFVVVFLATLGLLVANSIYPVFPRLANLSNGVFNDITNNWHNFLAGKKPDSGQVVINDPALNQRIDDEVRRQVAERLAQMEQSGQFNPSGLVVTQNGAVTPETIATTFSDRVEVKPDASGKSGILTPIFRTSTGAPYLYVLTPINQ